MFKSLLKRLSTLLIECENRTLRQISFLIIVSPVLIVAVYDYLTTYQDLTGAALLRREAVARLAASTLEEKLNSLTDVGVSLATPVQFSRLVGEDKWDEAIKILAGVPHNFSFVERVFLADPTGTLMADTPALPDVRGKNFSHRDWYKGVSRAWQPYISEVYRRAAEPRYNVVAVAIPITSGKVVGILVLQGRLGALFEWSKNIEVGPSEFIYFVDAAGRIAAHPNVPPQGEIVDYSRVPAVQNVLRGKQGVGIFYNPIAKEEQVVAYAPVPSPKWGVIAQQPARTAFAARDQNLRRLLAVYGFIFLLNCGLAYLILWTITRLKQAEAANSFLASIVRSSDDAIFGETLDGTIVSWNAGAERTYGYSEEKIKGRSVSILVPPDRSHELTQILSRIRRGEGVEQYETVRMRKDGRPIDVSLTVCPIKDANGKVTGGSIIARDISKQKQAEQTIKKLNEDLNRRAAELEAANKELEAFSYSVSHDLRAPLRAVDGFSRILLDEHASQLSEEGQRFLRLVRENAVTMGQLIDDLLTFSRLSRQPLKRQNVATVDLARQVLEELKREQNGRRIETCVADLPRCQGDPNLLKQVFVNLLSNALKYTRKRQVSRIEVGSERRNGETVYFVKDNGTGFDMRYADKLFGVFQRLHRAEEYEGTGVGLAIVQRVVHRHGGRVWAQADLDKGATFYFTLGGSTYES